MVVVVVRSPEISCSISAEAASTIARPPSATPEAGAFFPSRRMMLPPPLAAAVGEVVPSGAVAATFWG